MEPEGVIRTRGEQRAEDPDLVFHTSNMATASSSLTSGVYNPRFLVARVQLLTPIYILISALASIPITGKVVKSASPGPQRASMHSAMACMVRACALTA